MLSHWIELVLGLINERNIFTCQLVASIGGMFFYATALFIMGKLTLRSGQVNPFSVLGRFFTCGVGCFSLVFLLAAGANLALAVYWYYF